MVRDKTYRLARLRWDIFNVNHDYAWRNVGGFSNAPQTIPCNEVEREGKGSRIRITSYMDAYMRRVESNPDTTAWNRALNPPAGWLNKITDPLTCEPVLFAGNAVLTSIQDSVFTRLHVMPYSIQGLTDTFLTPNGCLWFHKMTAGNFTKVASTDIFIPAMQAFEFYWTLTSNLEFFPRLPFDLQDGHFITEYELNGDCIHGYVDNAYTQKILLYKPLGVYPTRWKMQNPAPPPMR